GPHQIHAAINAVHPDAVSYEETDWRQILTLYDMLAVISPTRVVALNRAVVVAEMDGPEVALGLVDELEMTSYHLWHATREGPVGSLRSPRAGPRGAPGSSSTDDQRCRGRIPERTHRALAGDHPAFLRDRARHRRDPYW